MGLKGFATLDKYVGRKARHARGNQMPFMTKDLSKYTMKRSRLRNIFFKEIRDENRKLYTKQRNHCVSLIKKTKTFFSTQPQYCLIFHELIFK